MGSQCGIATRRWPVGSFGIAMLVLAAATSSWGQPAQPTPLRNLVDDQVVARIGYCQGEYTLTMASGVQHRYPEVNLRFKTDGSRLGPDPGKPALLPAGMRGDRAQVIFAGLEDLKRFLVERC
jgi:cytochrome c